MNLLSLPTLFSIAGGCGIGLGLMLILTDRQRNAFANKANFVTSATKLASEQQLVKEMLGEPIEFGRASFNDGWSQMQRLHVKVRVPVKGQLDSAYLYAYARKAKEQDKLVLYRLEATFAKKVGKKLIIMDRSEDDDSEVDGLEVDNSVNKDTKSSTAEAKQKPKVKTKDELKVEMKEWDWADNVAEK